ncbi:hypothetical protein [Lysinibacillus sp. FSL K6-3209]|uniref:hypothetical protein n=1 Tax=Lysinibacillus sp. FSL K6-3209 TaxID=2921497 RepID=UPI0030DBD073
MNEKQLQGIKETLKAIRGSLSKISLYEKDLGDKKNIDRTSVIYLLSKAYSDFSYLKSIHYVDPCSMIKFDEFIYEYNRFCKEVDCYIDCAESIDSLLISCREINYLIDELEELLINQVRQ